MASAGVRIVDDKLEGERGTSGAVGARQLVGAKFHVFLLRSSKGDAAVLIFALPCAAQATSQRRRKRTLVLSPRHMFLLAGSPAHHQDLAVQVEAHHVAQKGRQVLPERRSAARTAEGQRRMRPVRGAVNR